MRSFELKILISIILFTLFIVGLERYQLSDNILEQFVESKKSRNNLLINTISPIVSLNISLGLDSSNEQYLNNIASQNSDLESIDLLDTDGKSIYMYRSPNIDPNEKQYPFSSVSKSITDYLTQDELATIKLNFSNSDYKVVIEKSREMTIKIYIITFVLLLLFVLLIKNEFKHLKKLTECVLAYDPKKNIFSLGKSSRKDEVSLIQNAVVSMVSKIKYNSDQLSELNNSLEQKVKDRTKELERSNEELKLLAATDPLTKLYNRRYFLNTSENILELAKRENKDLSIIMLDIDDFKLINDSYGHKVGDDAIVKIATNLKNITRNSDIICRFGGEEFIVLFPETNIEGAVTMANKIKERIRNTKIYTEHGEGIQLTVSIGVSQIDIKNDKNIEPAIRRSDKAMYKAKQSGKNKVCILDFQQ